MREVSLRLTDATEQRHAKEQHYNPVQFVEWESHRVRAIAAVSLVHLNQRSVPQLIVHQKLVINVQPPDIRGEPIVLKNPAAKTPNGCGSRPEMGGGSAVLPPVAGRSATGQG